MRLVLGVVAIVSGVCATVGEVLVSDVLGLVETDRRNSVDAARDLARIVPWVRVAFFATVCCTAFAGSILVPVLGCAMSVVFASMDAQIALSAAPRRPIAAPLHAALFTLLTTAGHPPMGALGAVWNARMLERREFVAKQAALALWRAGATLVFLVLFAVMGYHAILRNGGGLRELLHLMFALAPTALRRGIGKIAHHSILAVHNATTNA